MRITTGTIASFKELMQEIFYDWGMTSNPQLHQEPPGSGYGINKTALFPEDGQYILNYKMESYEVLPKVYQQFEDFFAFYENDVELEKVLTAFSHEWFSHDLEIKLDTIKVGDVQVFPRDYKYFIAIDGQEEVISKLTYQKVKRFAQLVGSI